jgi:outer membrane protein TolC
MKKFIIFFFLIYSAVSFSQQKLKLSDCLQLGLKNSKELQIANSKIVSSSAKVDEVRSQFLPQLKFSASYTRLSDVPPFEISVPFYPKPIQLAPSILNNYYFRLSLQQPLFTGFKLSSLKNAAELNRHASEEDFEKEKNETGLAIRIAFWNLYKAEQLKQITDENLEALNKHIEDTRNFMEQGLTTQNDLLKLQLQSSNTRLQQIDAENNIKLAKMNLNKTIGLPQDEPAEIETGEISISFDNPELAGLIKEAKNNRSELKALALRIEAGEYNVNAAKSTWYPSVYATGNYYYSNPNQRYQPPQDKFYGTWDIGVSLSWDIWNWGTTSAQTTQAEENVRQLKLASEQVQETIEMEINQNYLSLTYIKEKIDVTNTAIEQANENYRTTEEKYKHQLATSTDLIDARALLNQAEINKANVIADYQIAKIKLLKSAGKPVYNIDVIR